MYSRHTKSRASPNHATSVAAAHSRSRTSRRYRQYLDAWLRRKRLPRLHGSCGEGTSVNVSWVDRICPLCSSSDQSRVIAESNIDLGKLNSFAFASRKNPEYMHPRLVECPTCRLLYGSPVLTPESLADAYHEADFDSGKEAGYASQTYSAEIRKIIP